MGLLSRIVGWTLAVAALLLLIVTGVTYLWLRSSLPVTAGNLSVAGLNAPVEIVRDANGLVHIQADNPNDAYFALGYAHAQDRLWQMEAMRRVGAGRLAELVGARALPQDRLMRTLGLYARAEASLPLLSTEVRDALDAYARGVNTWISSHRGALPPEFALLGAVPEPWRPADSLVWGRLMAWNLSGNWRREMARARIEARLGRGATDRLFLPYPADGPVTIPFEDLAQAIGSDSRPPPATPAVARLLAALDDVLPPPPASRSASNAWVVAGARTAGGKPILANDPHLGFRAPNLWYLARITAPGLTVAGATAPGVPFHVLGHNGRIAWGMTTTGADTSDLVVEKLDPENPGKYLAPNGPRPFRTREEVIRVRGGEDVIVTVRETRNGPVFSDLAGGAADEVAPGTVIVLRSAMLRDDDRTAEALYRINRAGDWEAFTVALRQFESPVQNLIYADKGGNIGLAVAGRIPVRGEAGRDFPAPGDDAAYDWGGFISPDSLPRTYNPDRGSIVNANNRVVGRGYHHTIARDWEAPYRAKRIEDQLSARGRQDMAASRELQNDVVSYAARELVPLLVRATPRNADTGPTLDRLAAWKGSMRRDLAEPLLFHAWLDRLMRRLFADELGPLAESFTRVRPRLIQHVIESDTAWCDDVATGPTETCGNILASSLGEARAALAAQLGDPVNWRWGELHQAHFRNLVLDWIPLVGALTRITIPTDGDDFTVNRGTSRRGRGGNEFTHVHGATFRGIYDLGNLDRSLFAMPGGQSGNPLSDHYRDLTAGWRDGEYITLPARPTGEVETLRLAPRPGPEPMP